MDEFAIRKLFNEYRNQKTAISKHLDTLHRLSFGLDLVCEIGVKDGRSTTALLLGAKKVISVDIKETRRARELQRLAGDRWTYIIGRGADISLPICNMLFIDSDHTYYTLKEELAVHAHKAKELLVFHDTVTFGSYGADGESGQFIKQSLPAMSPEKDELGIRPAIDELMISDPSWHIARHDLYSHGLLVLRRS